MAHSRQTLVLTVLRQGFRSQEVDHSHEKQSGVPLKGAEEPDALSGWRKVIRFRPGFRKAAKTTYSRRVPRRPVEVERPEEEPGGPLPTAEARDP